MTQHIIVSLGQLIDTNFSKTMSAFSDAVEAIELKNGVLTEESALEPGLESNRKVLKKSIQQEFLTLVGMFRVNGLAKEGDFPEREALNTENERVFREKTRKLMGVSQEDLSDQEFDRIWCLMCEVNHGHAKRIKEVLSYPHSIIHSGTNSIQGKHIIQKLKHYGVMIAPDRLFLSFEQGCEYKGDQTLLHKIHQRINPQNNDQILLIQSTNNQIPELFQSVAKERYDNSAKTLCQLWDNTEIVLWNNKAKNDNDEPTSLIYSLKEHQKLVLPEVRIAYLVSSMGDTDLAVETIRKIAGPTTQQCIIPLTTVAKNKIAGLQVPHLEKIELPSNLLDLKRFTPEALVTISDIMIDHKIEHAYIGVPSPVDQEGALQVAKDLKISCTVVYEYMFKPQNHVFFDYVKDLAEKPGLNFAVPLEAAAEDIRELAKDAKIETIGHLCIDRALKSTPLTPESIQRIKTNLAVSAEQSLVFISGTTQPNHIDLQFIKALLMELSTGKYDNLQIRFGIHPGIYNPAFDSKNYFVSLMVLCKQYAKCSTQCKVIIGEKDKANLPAELYENNEFVMLCNDPSADIAKAADKVAQAVPGALTNEAALTGKQTYFDVGKSYLPSRSFSKPLATFLEANQMPLQNSSVIDNLGITTDAAQNLAYLSSKVRFGA